MEGLLKSLINSAEAAVKNPLDYEARSNIMWTATWALNTLVAKGKSTDWEVHMLGQAVGAHTDAAHGMTLSAVSLPYYRHILPYGLENSEDTPSTSGTSTRRVRRTSRRLSKAWKNGELDEKIGLVMNITELGASESSINDIADSVLIMDGGYKTLDKSEIREILKRVFDD